MARGIADVLEDIAGGRVVHPAVTDAIVGTAGLLRAFVGREFKPAPSAASTNTTKRIDPALRK